MRKLLGISLLGLAALLLTTKLLTVWIDPAGATTRIFPNLCVLLVLSGLIAAGSSHLRSAKHNRPRPISALLLLFIGATMTAYIALLGWADHHLAQRPKLEVYDDPHKIWSTTGLVVDATADRPATVWNSIESIGLAFEHGARGVEVDVFYDVEMAEFIVSHDRPYNLKNGALLTLDQLLAAVGDGGQFWLDWKKLRHLDQRELQASLDELETLAARYELKDRLYVEGEAPLHLRAFQRAGFKTICDTHPLSDANPLTPLVVGVYKLIYYFGDFTVFGLNSGPIEDPIFGPETQKSLRHVPIFVYHVPMQEPWLEHLAHMPNLRVILPDDHRIDRFGEVY